METISRFSMTFPVYMKCWQDEKKELLATIRRKEQEATVLTRRFELLQKTLKEQQKLLDRYQRALGVKDVGSDKTSSIRPPSRRHHVVLRPISTGSVNIPRSESKQDPKAWVTRKDPAFSSTAEKPPVVIHPAEKSTAGTSTPTEQSKCRNDKTSIRRFQIDETSSKRHRGLAATWAEEKRRMHKKPKWEKTVEQHNQVRARSGAKQQQEKQEKKGFAYVEVVRNRDERAALPAHDCVECKRYYDALGGLGSPGAAAAQMNKCSRHRARFEPYQTPDDFWRLSFPDSEHEPMGL
ncbi:DNA endonuclease rbbp8 [Phytophthora boehmeriae]|uniref:DNA endonuclease rbbp8 n=1 Tax=Phytophthora boehmeriae TaxID=109152 RepID=A0A8T1X599_9STRA|nr:DNA endonuclease rbbp8 [Phytophthora boehmeriae]